MSAEIWPFGRRLPGIFLFDNDFLLEKNEKSRILQQGWFRLFYGQAQGPNSKRNVMEKGKKLQHFLLFQLSTLIVYDS